MEHFIFFSIFFGGETYISLTSLITSLKQNVIQRASKSRSNNLSFLVYHRIIKINPSCFDLRCIDICINIHLINDIYSGKTQV